MDVELDFDIYRWKLFERMDFEKAAGMTAERALSLFAKVEEDEDAAMDIPAAVQAAFLWIAARRQDSGLTFATACEQFDGMAFMDAVPEEAEEAPLVEPNRAQRRSTKKSAAPSATTSTTPRRKSAT